MQRFFRKIMAPSRSPIELANKVSAIISLRNDLSILFLERILNPIKARSHSTFFWRDHEKAVYMSASQVSFDKRFEKKNLSHFLGLVPIAFMPEAYLHEGGNDA